LSGRQIFHQVVDPILLGMVPANFVKKISMWTMGLGEGLVNPAVAEAVDLFTTLFPEGGVVVSTMGPPNAHNVFNLLLNRARRNKLIQLQWSVHFFDDAARAKYCGIEWKPEAKSPLMLLKDAAKLIRLWRELTGNKVIANVGVGEHYAEWTAAYCERLPDILPPEDIEVKISLEGAEDGCCSDPHLGKWFSLVRGVTSEFKRLGYEASPYIPVGINSGGSCGSQVKPDLFGVSAAVRS
jgi:hypothetical protein